MSSHNRLCRQHLEDNLCMAKYEIPNLRKYKSQRKSSRSSKSTDKRNVVATRSPKKRPGSSIKRMEALKDILIAGEEKELTLLQQRSIEMSDLVTQNRLLHQQLRSQSTHLGKVDALEDQLDALREEREVWTRQSAYDGQLLVQDRDRLAEELQQLRHKVASAEGRVDELTTLLTSEVAAKEAALESVRSIHRTKAAEVTSVRTQAQQTVDSHHQQILDLQDQLRQCRQKCEILQSSLEEERAGRQDDSKAVEQRVQEVREQAEATFESRLTVRVNEKQREWETRFQQVEAAKERMSGQMSRVQDMLKQVRELSRRELEEEKAEWKRHIVALEERHASELNVVKTQLAEAKQHGFRMQETREKTFQERMGKIQQRLTVFNESCRRKDEKIVSLTTQLDEAKVQLQHFRRTHQQSLQKVIKHHSQSLAQLNQELEKSEEEGAYWEARARSLQQQLETALLRRKEKARVAQMRASVADGRRAVEALGALHGVRRDLELESPYLVAGQQQDFSSTAATTTTTTTTTTASETVIPPLSAPPVGLAESQGELSPSPVPILDATNTAKSSRGELAAVVNSRDLV